MEQKSEQLERKSGQLERKSGKPERKSGKLERKSGKLEKKIGLIGKNRDNIEMNWMATGKCQAIKIDHPHFGLARFTSL